MTAIADNTFAAAELESALQGPANEQDFATVKKHCGGSCNVDILAGWEKGVGPLRKIAGRLYDHWPPDHLEGQRREDWFWGYSCGKKYRCIYMKKTVHFSGCNQAGERVLIVRKGWGVHRGEVLATMEKKGVVGDVTVYFFEGVQLKRTVNSGI